MHPRLHHWQMKLLWLFTLWVICFFVVTRVVLAQGEEPPFWYYFPFLSTNSWRTSFVDSPRYISELGARAVQFKAAGLPCVVYGNDHLYYSCWDGAHWNMQVVDSQNGVGRFATLAFDRSGRPGVAYYDESNGSLKYAHWSGSAWDIEWVDSKDSEQLLLQEAGPPLQDGSGPLFGLISQKQGVGGYPSLAFSAASEPVISYYSYTRQDLKVASYKNGQWIIERVDSAGLVGRFSSLGLDEAGNPSVAYYDEGNGNLKLAARASTGIWSTRVISSEGDVGMYASLVLDKAGKPYIAFYDSTNHWLRYWANGTLITFSDYPNMGEFASLRLDARGLPWISVYDSGNTNLGLFRRNEQGGWNYTTVDSYDMVGRYGSLAVDSSGQAGMVYYHSSNCELRYASGTSRFNVKVVDTNTITGVYTSMAVLGSQPRIVYLNDSQSRLMYAYLDSSGWNTEVISSFNDTGVDASLALGKNGTAHVVFWQYHGGTPDGIVSSLHYIRRDSGGWRSFEIVDEGVGIGFQSSLAVDSNGNPHASYYDEGNGDLKYAYRSGGSWVVQTIDADGNVGNYSALALDSSNRPWISYYDETNGNLKVAHWNGSGWKIQTVDSAGNVGVDTALAVGPSGVVHVVYRDGTNRRLKHAKFLNQAWSTEVLDSAGSEPSIWIDSAGTVLVSYYDDQRYNLRFAYQSGGGWVYEDVDTPGDVGRYSSLAWGDDQRYRVSYLDVTNGDLKYAVRDPFGE